MYDIARGCRDYYRADILHCTKTLFYVVLQGRGVRVLPPQAWARIAVFSSIFYRDMALRRATDEWPDEMFLWWEAEKAIRGEWIDSAELQWVGMMREAVLQ